MVLFNFNPSQRLTSPLYPKWQFPKSRFSTLKKGFTSFGGSGSPFLVGNACFLKKAWAKVLNVSPGISVLRLKFLMLFSLCKAFARSSKKFLFPSAPLHSQYNHVPPMFLHAGTTPQGGLLYQKSSFRTPPKATFIFHSNLFTHSATPLHPLTAAS